MPHGTRRRHAPFVVTCHCLHVLSVEFLTRETGQAIAQGPVLSGKIGRQRHALLRRQPLELGICLGVVRHHPFAEIFDGLIRRSLLRELTERDLGLAAGSGFLQEGCRIDSGLCIRLRTGESCRPEGTRDRDGSNDTTRVIGFLLRSSCASGIPGTTSRVDRRVR